MKLSNPFANTVPKDLMVRMLPRLQAEKTKSFMTVVFTLVATGVFSFFAINPTLGTIADLRRQIDDSNFIEKKLEDKIAAMSSLQKQYQQIKGDIPTVETSIPTSPSIASFVAKVQQISIDTQCSLIRVQTYPVEISNLKTAIPAPYSSFAFSLDVTGLQGGLSSFLDKILNMDRLITVDGFSFAKASATDNTLRLNIKGKLYFKKGI